MNEILSSKVRIGDISPDEFFKISRKNYPENLPVSLRQSGMLEIPYIYRSAQGYNILTCHNRIRILRESGIQELDCIILDQPDADKFMNHAALKAYRNELGPVGKLKALYLLENFFRFSGSLLENLGSRILKIPREFSENISCRDNVLNMPVGLRNYLDDRDINFRIIKDLTLLPGEWISVIDRFLTDIPVRVNIFRMLTDNIFDIYRRGDRISLLESVSYTDDKTLYDSVFRIRYPEYSALKSKSDEILNELTEKGLTIDFPEYFDRGYITLKLEIYKNAECRDRLKKISDIDIDKLNYLLSLL